VNAPDEFLSCFLERCLGKIVIHGWCYASYFYFELPLAFLAAGGTRYWISIVNAPSEDSWCWEVSASLDHLGVQRSFEYGSWAPYFDNTAFRLKGRRVP
jgi:hypothetical protein